MNRYFITIMLPCFLFVVSLSTAGAFNLGQTIKGVGNVLGSGKQAHDTPASAETVQDPDEEKNTVLGIKEALSMGIQAAVNTVSVKDGFYKNNAIKILLPDTLQKVDTMIRKVGGGQLSEVLVQKMNRAAETAAPQALDIFTQAIKDMEINDAMTILSGKENAATTYLEENTADSLKSSFYPIVKTTMEEIGAVKAYNDYMGKFESNPLMQMTGMNTDINQYVTEKTIDGLFLMVANEEKKIRQNPAARVTDLLKSVFGKVSSQ